MRKRGGAYLKALREDSQQTQQEVAQKMGWTYYTMVSQIERGLARLPPEDVLKYASVLEVNAQELAQKLLYFYDPYMYHALFGGSHPLDIEDMPKDRSTREGKRAVQKAGEGGD
jgi:transcriptional regulator with XRE-family HTH domain